MKHSQLFVAALFTLSTQCIAGNSGFYLGGGVGYSSVDGSADTAANIVTSVDSVSIPPFSFIILDGIGLGGGGAFFDDNDVAWSGFAGYRFSRFVSVELGYSDLGEFVAKRPFSRSRDPVKLKISELSISGKFQYPVLENFSVNGWFGVTQNFFDGRGGLTVVEVDGMGTPVLGYRVDGPVTDPDDEVGYLWGLGVEWSATPGFDIGLNYIRHDTRVLEVDTISLSLIFSM